MNLTTEQVQALQHVALEVIKNETKTTKKVIEAIPAEKSHYKPDPVSMSALELAKHIALSDVQFLQGILNAKFDFSGKLPESVQTPHEIAAWYGEEMAKIEAGLGSISPEKLGEVLDFMGFMQMPGVLFLNMAVNHSIHHRGQLTTHIRPMGGKVPSIYGPSYEDEQAQKAASA
jgi:uncharacterized damage-inducible protein DinB